MAQKLVQSQQLTQTQTLTPQQLQVVRLLELPVTELEERVQNELLENAALEENSDNEAAETSTQEETTTGGDEEYAGTAPETADALGDYLTSDDVPDYLLARADAEREEREIPFGSSTSFYERLRDQISEHDLTEREAELMEYLIGSLDDDGLLRKDFSSISDELLFNYGLETTPAELEDTLHVIQDFDPPGVGARSLQECLLIQIRRKDDSPLKTLEQDIIGKCYDEFTHKHWDKIKQRLGLTDAQFEDAKNDLVRLNPRPGSSLGETVGRPNQQIVPDFLVETLDDGTVTLALNDHSVPELHVSREFADMLDEHTRNRANQSKESRETMMFLKQKMDAAQGFINAVKQRQQTMLSTMRAIIDLQMPFFREGDESLLRPMILKDVAALTGLDISTISRVSNSKYVQTNYGIYPLKFFFSDGYTTDEGEELSVREIRRVLKECVEKEDKSHPLTDDELARILKDKGFAIARRTVAKYREQLGIPVARLRK